MYYPGPRSCLCRDNSAWLAQCHRAPAAATLRHLATHTRRWRGGGGPLLLAADAAAATGPPRAAAAAVPVGWMIRRRAGRRACGGWRSCGCRGGWRCTRHSLHDLHRARAVAPHHDECCWPHAARRLPLHRRCWRQCLSLLRRRWMLRWRRRCRRRRHTRRWQGALP